MGIKNFFNKIFNKNMYDKAFINELLSKLSPFEFGFGAPTPTNYSQYLNKYETEIWVYACTFVIANTIASIPHRLYKKSMVKGKIVETEIYIPEFEKLFERPNTNDANSTGYNLMEWTVANLELSGDAFWLLNDIVRDRPREIQMLPTKNMRIVPGKTKDDPYIKEYKFISGMQEQIFLPEEIVHFKYMSPIDMFYGQGSLAAARIPINSHKAASTSNFNRFENGLPIGGALETDKIFNDEQFGKIRKRLIENYQGTSKSGLPMICEGGLKYKDTLGNAKDMEYIAGLKLTREEICAAFGVPPPIVGILDHSTYSNFEQAEKVYLSYTILPKLKRLAAVIEAIARRYDPTVYFEYITSGIEALQEDELRKAEIATRYFAMGVPFNKINNRFDLGFDDIPNGDVGFIPIGLQPVERAINPPEPIMFPQEEENETPEEAEKKKAAKIAKYYTKDRKMYLAKQFDTLTNKIEKYYTSVIDKFFLGLEITMIRALNNAKKTVKEGEDENRDPEYNAESVVYSEDRVINDWVKKSRKIHKIAVQGNGQAQLNNLGVSISFDVHSPFVEAFLEEFSLRKARQVIGANREELIKAIKEGYANGESIEQITRRLKKIYEPYKNNGYRARRIAQTEVISASNRGALEAYRQLDPNSKKFWLPSYYNTRDTHLQAGATYSEDHPIPLDEPFKVGMGSCMHPGETGLGEEDINCRCAVLPYVTPGDFV